MQENCRVRGSIEASAYSIHRHRSRADTLHPHSRANESLDDWHLGLAELLVGISAGGVWEPDWVADLDVVLEGDVLALCGGERVVVGGRSPSRWVEGS